MLVIFRRVLLFLYLFLLLCLFLGVSRLSFHYLFLAFSYVLSLVLLSSPFLPLSYPISQVSTSLLVLCLLVASDSTQYVFHRLSAHAAASRYGVSPL